MIKLIEWEFYETVKLTNEEILLRLNSKFGNTENTLDYIQIWKYKVCKENLKATANWIDIWEKDWKCYFTQAAAIRESKKQWLILPSIERWGEIIKEINSNINLNKWWKDDTSIRTTLWLELSGFRGTDGGFYNQGDFGYYWSSSEGHYVRFDATQVFLVVGYYPSFSFSARCVKN